MNFIEQLRKLGASLPPSHVPSLNELAGVVGAVIAHAEHGDSILRAAEHGAEEVAKLLAPVAADVADAAAPELAPLIGVAEQAIEHLSDATPDPPYPPPPAVPDEAETVAELRKQLEAAQTQIAVLSRGQVVVSEAGA